MTKRYQSQKHAELVRTEACRCAATVLAGRPGGKYAPDAWSLAVFFESYISEGPSATQKAFGPKPPAKLMAVR